MKIQVITRDNGFGLTKDIQVIREAFPDATVDFTDWKKPRRDGKWDWNIHLELIHPGHFNSARVNAFVPNPEWYDPSWSSHLTRFDVVVAKTEDCARIFSTMHRNVQTTGWTSQDPGKQVDYTMPGVLHIAGKSIMKGTPQVLEVARQLPGVQFHLVVDKTVKAPENVKQYVLPTNDQLDELKRIPIRLQPSTYEGYGHVLNEARAMGAVTITTDAGPMTEVGEPEYTLLCPPSHTRIKALAKEQVPDVDALEQCVRMALNNLSEYGPMLGAKAREAYLKGREMFHAKIRSLVR